MPRTRSLLFGASGFSRPCVRGNRLSRAARRRGGCRARAPRRARTKRTRARRPAATSRRGTCTSRACRRARSRPRSPPRTRGRSRGASRRPRSERTARSHGSRSNASAVSRCVTAATARASAARSPQSLTLCENPPTKMRRFERRVALGAALVAATAWSSRIRLRGGGRSANVERRAAHRAAARRTSGSNGSHARRLGEIWHTSSDACEMRARALSVEHSQKVSGKIFRDAMAHVSAARRPAVGSGDRTRFSAILHDAALPPQPHNG